MERLAASTPQRVCVRTFTFGDVIWKCRTCQVGDDTCVVCQACFQGGDHKGHDVSFYISRQPDGGCCDCGDESAWAPSGFCKQHGQLSSTEELLATVPPPLLDPATVIFSATFGQLARAVLASSIPRQASTTDDPLTPARLHRLTSALEWITSTCVRFDGLCCVASATLRAPVLDAAAESETLRGSLSDVLANLDLSVLGRRDDDARRRMSSTTSSSQDIPEIPDLQTALRQHGQHEPPPPPQCPTALAEELRRVLLLHAERGGGGAGEMDVVKEAGGAAAGSASAAAGGDQGGGGRAGTSAGSSVGRLSLLGSLLLSDARLREFGAHTPHALQALYLRLLTNSEFKHAFACAYATHYTHLATSYMSSEVCALSAGCPLSSHHAQRTPSSPHHSSCVRARLIISDCLPLFHAGAGIAGRR